MGHVDCEGAIMIRDFTTIDADAHVLEPLDLWVRYIDPAYREQAPRYIVDADGTERLRVEGREKVYPKGMGGTGSFETLAVAECWTPE